MAVAVLKPLARALAISLAVVAASGVAILALLALGLSPAVVGLLAGGGMAGFGYRFSADRWDSACPRWWALGGFLFGVLLVPVLLGYAAWEPHRRAAAAAEEGVARRRATHDQVRALHATGGSVAQIARTVGASRMTVYKYLREGPPQRKRHSVHGRQRVLEPYEPYLLRRWNEGCRMATVLWREIRTQGFAHSLTNVQRFVAELRREGPPATGHPRTALTKPHGPPPRLAAALVLRRPERRSEEQRAYLTQLRAEDATVATVVDVAEDFLCMLRRREGARLEAWLDRAAASGVDDLARFAGKPRADEDAVQAGLTLRHGNGQTEGHVNRLKLVKRQGYGRAKVDLLRKRLLRAA